MLTFASTEGLTDIITVLCQVLLSSFSALPILVTDVALSDWSTAKILRYNNLPTIRLKTLKKS